MLMPLFWIVLSGLMVVPALAEEGVTLYPEFKTTQLQSEEKHYLANITIHSPDELKEVLRQADIFYEDSNYHLAKPIKVVVHGAEAEVFITDRYRQYKPIVKLAAQLQSLEVVDIFVCETWIQGNGYEKKDFYNFVGTVPFGPAEMKRLLNMGYVYF